MTEPAHADKTDKPNTTRQSTEEPAFSTLTSPLPRLDKPTLNPRNLLQLQRMVGNRAVLRLLQRDLTAEPPFTVLTQPQVAQALAWYAGQTHRYTPQIIQQIRGEVERGSITGPLTADDVQAIAQWQLENNIEEHDGRAGTITLAAMFPSGLATDEAIGAFAGAAQGLEREWQFLDATQRLQRLEQIINDRLQAAGVPHVSLLPSTDIQDQGQFHRDHWHMLVSQSTLDGSSGGTLTSGDIPEIAFADVVEVLYHEARHAEQAFLRARMLAGRGQSASYIRRYLRLPDSPVDIAASAVANPLAPDSMSSLIAQGWDDAEMGPGYEEYDETYRVLGVTQADYLHSREEASEHPGDEEHHEAAEGATRRFERAWDRYDDLPEEADALRAGERARDAYMLPTD